MDRKLKLEIFVGLFVVIGIVAAAMLVLRTSGLTLTDYNKAENYRLYAYFDNIGGLTIRSRITMAGVRVGSVTDIVFDKEQQQARVEMGVRREIDFLTTDTSASIQTSGILGEQYIELISGADKELLEDGDTITFTQSAIILENLIGKFLFDAGEEK